MEYYLFRLLSKLSIMANEQIPVHRHGLPHLECYDVTEDELDRIEREGNDLGVDFQVGLFSLTLASSFLANLLLTPVEVGKVYNTFVIIVVVGFLFGFTHLIKWYRHRGAFALTIRRIRERQVGPVGEQGKELKPSDLAELQSTEPIKDKESRDEK